MRFCSMPPLASLGVNLIYGCHFLFKQPNDLLQSLYDELDKDRIEIDTIQMNGPDFAGVDNRCFLCNW